MNIEPLSKEIFEKAKRLGVTKIHLNFSGGSDEGFLSVHIEIAKGMVHYGSEFNDEKLAEEVEVWAYEDPGVYDYSGAGDGSDYGDDITYNIEDMTATHSEWYMSRQDGDTSGSTFSIAEDEE